MRPRRGHHLREPRTDDYRNSDKAAVADAAVPCSPACSSDLNLAQQTQVARATGRARHAPCLELRAQVMERNVDVGTQLGLGTVHVRLCDGPEVLLTADAARRGWARPTPVGQT